LLDLPPDARQFVARQPFAGERFEVGGVERRVRAALGHPGKGFPRGQGIDGAGIVTDRGHRGANRQNETRSARLTAPRSLILNLHPFKSGELAVSLH